MGKIANSPLIEAIFELRWGEKKPGTLSYSQEETDFLPGLFFKEVSGKGFVHTEAVNSGPERPPLPFDVKHRFRKSENVWPCYQIGLGVFTTNQLGNKSLQSGESDEYDWDDFKPTIFDGITALDNSLSDGLKGLSSPQAFLRYQDAFHLDDRESLEEFISHKINTDIKIANVFTDQEHIASNADNVRLELSYKTSKPEGVITITVLRAMIDGRAGVLIDTTVASSLANQDLSPDSLIEWCEQAHDLQRHSFNTLIQTKNL